MPRERCGPASALDYIFIKIHKDEVIGWRFKLLISAFNSYNIWAGSFDGLKQTCGKDGNIYPRPLKRKQQFNERFTGQVEHTSV